MSWKRRRKRKRNPSERTAAGDYQRVVSDADTTPDLEKLVYLNQFWVASFATDFENLDEVHVMFETRDTSNTVAAFGMRFKSPEAIAVFIEELIAYRRYVWPEAEDPNFDAEALPPTRVTTGNAASEEETACGKS